MINNIVEENPNEGGADDKVRKQARQLAYDVRYKVKAQFKGGQKADPASLKRAYISQLGKSPAPGPVKQLAKKMLIGEEYDFIDLDTSVNSVISNVMSKVFVEGIEEEPEVLEEDGKYKVRVTDKKSGKSYVRMADRAKISELRKNPNIASVEMTGYGSPYDKAPSKKKAKKDFDGDGKVESPKAEYKGSKDKAIKKALAKEGFQLDEADIADIIARLEKKRISKGGNPDDSPLGKKTGQAMKAKQDAARKKAGVKTEGYQRDPEKLKKDKTHSKQPDPSKDGFTGIGNMSIKDIMKMNKKMKKEEVENIDELKSTTLLSYSNKAANELAFKGDGGKKAQKRATGVKRAAGKLTMKAINKEEVSFSPTSISKIRSILDGRNSVKKK